MSAIDCCVVSAVETNRTDVVTASVKSVQRGMVKLIFLNCGIMLIMIILLPGRLIGAMRLVGVEGGNTKVPGIPGDGSATYRDETDQ